jgi:hypothetical protein
MQMRTTGGRPNPFLYALLAGVLSLSAACATGKSGSVGEPDMSAAPTTTGGAVQSKWSADGAGSGGGAERAEATSARVLRAGDVPDRSPPRSYELRDRSR